MRNNKQQGFTLVEMSIVLVIIGLIVGGVLVGQDLVKAAQVRAVVSQIQQYDAAVNTFRGKYEGLPGDLSKASAYLTGTPTPVNGDGDGVLDDSGTGVNGLLPSAFDLEYLSFWYMLSLANMVSGQYTQDGTTNTTATVAGGGFPATKLKKGSVIAVSEGATLRWVVGGGTDLSTITDIAGSKNLTPTEAFGIDNKLDDGIANTGLAEHVESNTAAASSFPAFDASTGSATTCWADAASATAPADYLLANQTNACVLIIRVQG
jgi:prepilin-type N-terminal cleavage/methylation domain-containing protein